MRFQLLISCNNEAFGGEDDTGGHRDFEVARIIRDVADALEAPLMVVAGEEHTVRDLNGNTVGTWAFIEDDAGTVDTTHGPLGDTDTETIGGTRVRLAEWPQGWAWQGSSGKWFGPYVSRQAARENAQAHLGD